MPRAKEKEQGFEESLGALEKIVAQLESGDLPLERALDLFEEGVGLARRCQTQLNDAEQKVEILLRERGSIRTVPFESKNEVLLSQSMVETSLSSAPSVSPPPPAQKDELELDQVISDDSIPF